MLTPSVHWDSWLYSNYCYYMQFALQGITLPSYRLDGVGQQRNRLLDDPAQQISFLFDLAL